MKKLAKLTTLTMTAGMLLAACGDNGSVDDDMPEMEDPADDTGVEDPVDDTGGEDPVDDGDADLEDDGGA